MSPLIARASGAVARRTAFGGYGAAMQKRTAVGIAQDTQKKTTVLQKGAKRDPELYVSRSSHSLNPGAAPKL